MSRPSFPAAWGRYRAYLQAEQQRRPATVRSYRFALFRFFAFLDGKPWDKATARDLGRFLDRRSDNPHAGRVRLAAASRRHYAAAVRGFYRWATAEGLLARDPMTAVSPPRGDTPIPRSLPLGDLRTILVAAAGDERLQMMVVLGFFCAMRAGEISRALIEDVYLVGGQPRIRVDGKGGRVRMVPLHPQAEWVLRGYLARRPHSGPLVASRDPAPGRHLSPSTVSRCLSRHIQALGIDGSAHSLRHSAATQALEAAEGANLEEVREFLGHADTRTTRRYVAAYQWQVRRRAVDLLPDLTADQ